MVEKLQGVKLHAGRGWATESEMTFLENLGRWNPGNNALADRKTLLKRYLQSMDLRVEWGYIHQEVIRSAVKNMLKKEK